MRTAIAIPGNTASTFPIHFFGSGPSIIPRSVLISALSADLPWLP